MNKNIFKTRNKKKNSWWGMRRCGSEPWAGGLATATAAAAAQEVNDTFSSSLGQENVSVGSTKSTRGGERCTLVLPENVSAGRCCITWSIPVLKENCWTFRTIFLLFFKTKRHPQWMEFFNKGITWNQSNLQTGTLQLFYYHHHWPICMHISASMPLESHGTKLSWEKTWKVRPSLF